MMMNIFIYIYIIFQSCNDIYRFYFWHSNLVIVSALGSLCKNLSDKEI